MTAERPEHTLSRRQFLIAGAASAALTQTATAQTPPPLSVAEPLPRPGEVLLRLTVNGRGEQLAIDPRLSLLDVLRESLDLTSVKRGCDEGTCGSCTVLLDGKRVPACLIPAALCHDQAVTTVEGLAVDGELSAIQTAFVRHQATDCGFCTPGQVVAAQAILQEPWGADEESLASALCGQECACGRRPQIVAAIQEVRGKRS